MPPHPDETSFSKSHEPRDFSILPQTPGGRVRALGLRRISGGPPSRAPQVKTTLSFRLSVVCLQSTAFISARQTHHHEGIADELLVIEPDLPILQRRLRWPGSALVFFLSVWVGGGRHGHLGQQARSRWPLRRAIIADKSAAMALAIVPDGRFVYRVLIVGGGGSSPGGAPGLQIR